jgi:hypothetical protein
MLALNDKDKQVVVRAKRLGIMPKLYLLFAGYEYTYFRLCGWLSVQNGEAQDFALRKVIENLNFCMSDAEFVWRVNDLMRVHTCPMPKIPCVKMKYS